MSSRSPSQSIPARAAAAVSCLPGSSRAAATSVATPIGRLTPKTRRQPLVSPKAWMIRPPAIGPERGRDADDGAHDREGLAPEPAGEEQLDERGDGGHEDAAGQALHHAEHHELGVGLRQPAGGARQGEEGDAGEEDPLVADPVADPARRDEGEAEGERVARDDPRERGLGRVQARADGGQRHVHDRGVQQGDEHPRQQDHQGLPRAAGDLRRRRPAADGGGDGGRGAVSHGSGPSGLRAGVRAGRRRPACRGARRWGAGRVRRNAPVRPR